MKKFLNYNMQFYLLRSKGIVKNFEKSKVKKILINENYYSLINGYRAPFLDSNNKYLKNTSFFELYDLYNFDRALRNILFKKILIIESKLKSVIAYTFSKKYENDYLNIENYDILLKTDPQYQSLSDKQKQNNNKKLENITSLISTLTKIVSDNSDKKEFVNHYLLKYHQIPLWVLVNVLTFGNLSKFYSVLKQPQKQKIAQSFKVKDNILKEYIKILGLFRNACAHEERCYCFRFRGDIQNTPHHQRLNIPIHSSGTYLFGKTDFFAVMIILKELLSKKYFDIFKLKLDEAILKLDKKLKSISINDIYLIMGLPQNWRDL